MILDSSSKSFPFFFAILILFLQIYYLIWILKFFYLFIFLPHFKNLSYFVEIIPMKILFIILLLDNMLVILRDNDIYLIVLFFANIH